MTRSIETRRLRSRLQATEQALAEARALNAELHAQLSRANAVAVRMARRVVVEHAVRNRVGR